MIDFPPGLRRERLTALSPELGPGPFALDAAPVSSHSGTTSAERGRVLF